MTSDLFVPPEQYPYDSVALPPALPPGWRVVTAEGDQVAQAERLEYEVFAEIGFCEPSSERRTEELDPWREESRFRVVVTEQGEVRGVARELLGRYEELPVGSFERTIGDYPPDPVLECASLAVPSAERNAGLAEALLRVVCLDTIREAAGAVAIGAEWLLPILNDTYGFGFRQLGPSRWYMGSDCLPVGTTVEHLIERLRQQPTFFRWLTQEVDLRDHPMSEVRRAVTDLDTAER